MVRRVLAVLVLVLVALLAIRLVMGFVTAVLWIVVVVALAAAGLWAWSTLRSGKRRREVKPASSAAELEAAPGEDRVAAEMRRITEQLREQGRA
jgi:hypothetical protein